MTEFPGDDQLRQAFRALSKDEAFGGACPPAERLWSGARGELAPAEVESLALHLAECGACAEAWRVARDFGAPVTMAAPRAAARDWRLAAAAVVVLAAGAALFYFTGGEQTPSAPTLTSIKPSFTIPVERAPIAVSSRYALTFRGPNDGQLFLAALKTALEPYERADYQAAVRTLTAVHTQYRDTMEPAFYLGVAQLLAGDATAAVTSLEHARDLAEPDRIEEVAWYLASAYERAGRPRDALRFAQSVCEARGPRAAVACDAAKMMGSRP